MTSVSDPVQAHDGMVPPSISVWADGTQLNDNSFDFPYVLLDDLSVSWGRKTTLDQPAVGTCTFSLLSDGQAFLSRIHIGSDILVRADAIIYPDEAVSPVLRQLVWLPEDSRNQNVSGPAVRPVDASKGVVMMFGPAALAEPGPTGSTAWDSQPMTVVGQTLTYKATITLPALFNGWDGWKATVQPVLYTAPHAGNWYAAANPTEVLSTTTTGAYTFTGTVTPPGGFWLGLRVVFFPTGPSWSQLNTFAWQDQGTRSWDSLAVMALTDVGIIDPATGVGRAASVFTGRVTDIQAAWDGGSNRVIAKVICRDERGEIANRDIGGEPWPAESIALRFDRIMDAAELTGFQYELSPSAMTPIVTWMDVDRQQALSLLDELAVSADAVLWSASSLVFGPYLYLESMNDRAPLLTLEEGIDGLVRIVSNFDPLEAGAVELDACNLSLNGVWWISSVADYSTRVIVRWLEQVVDPETSEIKPTDRSVELRNEDDEALYGVYRDSIGTKLTTEAAANSLASSLLGRLNQRTWRLDGLEWDTAVAGGMTSYDLDVFMTILDGSSRLGLPMVMTNLPDWTPIPMGQTVPYYLEGGTFRSRNGAWSLDLDVSSGVAAGNAAIAWNELPSSDWSWDMWDEAVTWASLAGVDL